MGKGWAAKGTNGLAGTSAGVDEYTIGTRRINYRGTADQAIIVDYWQRMVTALCPNDPVVGLPG